MSIQPNFLKSVFALAMAFLVSMGIAGCGKPCDKKDKTEVPAQTLIEAETKPPVAVKGQPTDAAPSEKLLPIKVGFLLDGTPVILDDSGRPVKSEKLEFPVETKKIYSLKTLSVGFIEGSCQQFILYGNSASISEIEKIKCQMIAEAQAQAANQ